MTWIQAEPVSDEPFDVQHTRCERAKAYSRKAERRLQKKRRMQARRAFIGCCLLWVFALTALVLTMKTGLPHPNLPPGVLMRAVFAAAAENSHAL